MRLPPFVVGIVSVMTLLLWTVAAGQAAENGGQWRPVELRCEALANPLGIGEKTPVLSWVNESARRSERQTAYQVLVASSAEALNKNEADLWDSARVEGDASTNIVYAGKGLNSRANCYWKVRTWDRDGQPSPWSEPAHWTVGLLVPEDWSARWVDGSNGESRNGAKGEIVVKQAIYQVADESQPGADVTAVVAKLVAGGQREFKVTNDALGGDPAPQKPKGLRVTFSIGGREITKAVAENQTFSFDRNPLPPRYLRKTFSVAGDQAVRSATLYVTALGLYEARLNGERVGDHFFAPEWTDYHKRVRYQAYDVTALVRPGTNCLGALVGDGWYAGHLGNGGFQQYGTIPALLAQLEITRADGSVERVVSDGSWVTHASPLLSSDFMFGESYDARLELPGWDQPTFVVGPDWTAATVREESAARSLDTQVMPPVRATGERKPITLSEPAPGHWTYDLGQNMVGVVRLKLNAPAGTVVTLRHAEMLKPDGTIYTTNLRGAPSVDTYICKGGGEETFQPRFTFHGFRYVELTGVSGKPAADAVTGVVVGTDDPVAGSFITSDAKINQLVSNIEWGQRGNYLSVPTDCPQRDERLGWMGDAQVFVRSATNIADVQAFFHKWLVDVNDAQTPEGAFTDVSPARGTGAGTPAWGDAGVICPWTIYEAYGDRRILERCLEPMTRWVEWCRAHSTNLLRDHDRGGDYGDWLSINADTPKDVIGTAYFAYSTHLLAKACKALGREEDAAKYQALFEEIRQAFNQAYVAADGRIKGNTQCGYVMALKFELLSDELQGRAIQYLTEDIAAKGNHLSTGFVGVSYLLPVLTQGGKLDVAYTLLNQDTFPSWLFSVKQGATTIWERWDGWTPDKGFQDAGMNSFNHYSLGSCGEWLYDTVAGIGWDTDAPGYKHLVVRPRPGGGLTMVKAGLRTVYGPVSSAWTVGEGRFNYELTVPANTTATVTLPTADAAGVLADGKPLAELKDAKLAEAKDGDVTFALGSGSYKFACPVR